MFWRRGRKESDDRNASKAANSEEDDLIKLQRQFGIKPVSDKDVEAEFLKLMGGGGKSGGLGLGLSPRSELALLGGSGDSDEEEAKIMRELNISGKLDSINAEELSGEDVDEGDDSDDDDDPSEKIAKREVRAVLAQIQKPAASKPVARPAPQRPPIHHSPAERRPSPPSQQVKPPVVNTVDQEDDDEVEVTEEDMNDPAYAAELAKLGFGGQAPKTAKPPPPPVTSSPSTTASNGQAHVAAAPPLLSPSFVIPEVPESKEEEVEVTDEDMNDPAFAAELAKMGFSPTSADATPIVQTQTPVQFAPSANPTTQPHHKHIPQRASSVNDDDLIDEFDDDDDDDAGGDNGSVSMYAQPLVSVSAPDASSSPEGVATPVTTNQEPPQQTTGLTIENLQNQLQKAKLSAVSLKREGNIQAALEMMRRIKQIENLISLKQARAPADTPTAPATLAAPPSAPLTPQLSREAIERNTRFNELDALLVRFANDATSLAKEQLAVNRTKAAEWLAKRKAYSAHLATLREKRLIPGQSPPAVRIEQVIENVEVECIDVPADELHVRITSVNELQQVAGKEIFVKYNLGFPTSAPQEGKTGVVRVSSSAPFSTGPITSDNSYRAKIQRARGTTRLFEIRKATFEVWRPGSLLRNPELVVRASQELAPLLSMTEVKTHVPFLGPNRKPVGGDVEISLRVRTPLRDKQYRQVVSEILHVGEYPPPQELIAPVIQQPVVVHSVVPVASQPPRESIRPHSHSDASSRVSSTTVAHAVVGPTRTFSAPALPSQQLPVPQVAAPAPVARTPAAAPSPVEDQEDPHDLDLIISYDVINDEITRIEATLPKLQGAAVEEYSDRLDSLGLKKQLLEIDMQTGKLTLDAYVARLKQRIVDDRKIVMRLLKSGRKPDAARVLHRVKIMEKELEGAEGGGEEGEEQE